MSSSINVEQDVINILTDINALSIIESLTKVYNEYNLNIEDLKVFFSFIESLYRHCKDCESKEIYHIRRLTLIKFEKQLDLYIETLYNIILKAKMAILSAFFNNLAMQKLKRNIVLYTNDHFIKNQSKINRPILTIVE